ncbi:MAG: hypothetical protein KGZ53_04450 [Peptococcaceae bacterium]|nr:hypothetical protein [Peptococcaceae bacterium]
MKKTLLAILLGVGLLLAPMVEGAHQSSISSEDIMVDVLTSELGLSLDEANIVQNQWRAMENVEVIHKMIESDSKLADVYGGNYLGKDGLTVQFTQPVKEHFSKMNGVTVEVVKYTYKELKAVHSAIDEVAKELKVEGIGHVIQAAATDVISNTVHVWIRSMDKDVIASVVNKVSLKTEVDAKDAITFIKAEEINNATNIINGWHHADQYGQGATIGFRARRLNSGVWENGYISTGHVSTSSGQSVYDINPQTGTWTLAGVMRAKHDGGTVDASFIAAASGRTPSRTFMNGDSYAYVLQSPNQIGLYVESYGGTSLRTTGYISQTDWKAYDQGGNLIYWDMIRASYHTDSGDSGCAVTWIRYVGSASAVRCVTGVTKAWIGSDHNNSVYSRVNAVFQQFGAEDY